MGDRAAVQELQAPTVPPQNLDAEESVLGAMMLSPGAIAAVSEILSSDGREFYRESHAKIYRAALALYAKGEPVDAITLVDEIDERGARGRRWQGAHPRAGRLVPAAANSGHYARIVHESAAAPRAHPRGRRDRPPRLGSPGRHDELVDRAEQILFDLSQERAKGEFTHIEELLKESFERITALYESGADVTGVPPAFAISTASRRDSRKGTS